MDLNGVVPGRTPDFAAPIKDGKAMLKICALVVAGLLAPLMAWLMVPTLICLVALAAFSLPIVVLMVVFKPTKPAPGDAAWDLPVAKVYVLEDARRKLAA
jgi:hypothetical protein